MKLDIKAFALTCALLWGFGLFLITWWIICFEGQADPASPPPFIGLVYRGYDFTTTGSFVGLAWAFVDGLIGGAVFAWLYNCLVGRKASG
jgi:hypothetical protein